MEDIAVMEGPVIVTDMKKKLSDVLMAISWREFANTYFQRSSSWFYHKMDGIDGNGGQGGFNEEEAEQMRGALIVRHKSPVRLRAHPSPRCMNMHRGLFIIMYAILLKFQHLLEYTRKGRISWGFSKTTR